VVAGYLLGGLSPRRESADLREKLRETQRELIDARKKVRGARRTNVLPLPGLGELYDPPEVEEEAPDEGERRARGGPPRSVTIGGEGGGGDDRPPIGEEQFDIAVDAQRLRAEQARAALAEQADLDDDDLAAFDDVIADMNDRLEGMAGELVDLAWAGEDAPAGDLLSVSHEVTGVLLDAQDELDAMVDPDVEVDDAATQVWNYVDLDVLRGAVTEAGEGRR